MSADVFPSTSFIYLIETAVIAHLQEVLGEGSDTYLSPEWLHVRTIGHSGGRPIPEYTEAQTPAIWLEYIAGGEENRKIGLANMPSEGKELWNVFAVMYLTPEKMEIGRDLAQFREWGVASADTLMRRMVLVLNQFDPDQICPLLNLATNGQRVTTWACAVQAGASDFELVARIALRYEVTTEA